MVVASSRDAGATFTFPTQPRWPPPPSQQFQSRRFQWSRSHRQGKVATMSPKLVVRMGSLDLQSRLPVFVPSDLVHSELETNPSSMASRHGPRRRLLPLPLVEGGVPLPCYSGGALCAPPQLHPGPPYWDDELESR
ncbi:uncharacterized protein LOC133887172 [Phragmites australis]|uniref:uncharacterized protein LOC133887172 n=1 Tax=Phragmites australis TaxID=29695 RepID=UPI002D76D6E7|nr:uncharacterized protein LOC133887172 [Phragmites australis]